MLDDSEKLKTAPEVRESTYQDSPFAFRCNCAPTSGVSRGVAVSHVFPAEAGLDKTSAAMDATSATTGRSKMERPRARAMWLQLPQLSVIKVPEQPG